MDNKLGDLGSTLDGGTEQNREIMPEAEGNADPMPLGSTLAKGVDGTRSLSASQKEKIEANSRRKLDYLQAEYWRLRNGKQDYMRCPYCVKGRHGRRRNFVDGPICCVLFAKAFGAILERQNQVDIAQKHASNIIRLGQMVEGRPN
jgi:hypothetical protein